MSTKPQDILNNVSNLDIIAHWVPSNCAQAAYLLNVNFLIFPIYFINTHFCMENIWWHTTYYSRHYIDKRSVVYIMYKQQHLIKL